MPAVSIIMPCFNHARFLSNSVASILSQSLPDLELIVVDDFSTDTSREILSDLSRSDSRITVIHHERNYGASRSRNDGLRIARGAFIGFCDADDLWKPVKLERQLALFRQFHEIDIAYCDSEIINEHGVTTGRLFSDDFKLPTPPSGNLYKSLSLANFINMQTVLIRRRGLGDSIYFDESIKWVEDWWQWIRLSKTRSFIYDSEVLASYRVHSNSTGFTQKPGIRRNRWKVCRRNISLNKDIPDSLRLQLWYMMSRELSLMQKHRAALRFLMHSMKLGLFAKTDIFLLIKIAYKILTETGRLLLPKPGTYS